MTVLCILPQEHTRFGINQQFDKTEEIWDVFFLISGHFCNKTHANHHEKNLFRKKKSNQDESLTAKGF